jgi:ArsR family transcriptional regulator
MDLLPHDEDWVRERLGHTRQGFSVADLESLLREIGLVEVSAEGMPTRGDEPFRPLIATGRKPGGVHDG